MGWYQPVQRYGITTGLVPRYQVPVRSFGSCGPGG